MDGHWGTHNGRRRRMGFLRKLAMRKNMVLSDTCSCRFDPFLTSWMPRIFLKSFLEAIRFNSTVYEPVATLKISNRLNFHVFFNLNCSSIFPETNIFWKGRSRPIPSHHDKKRPQMDYLVMNFSSKRYIFVQFYNRPGHFWWKNTCPFPGIKNHLQKTLCFASRHLLFSFYENKHFSKQLVSYLTPGQATMRKIIANWFSRYENLVKKLTF